MPKRTFEGVLGTDRKLEVSSPGVPVQSHMWGLVAGFFVVDQQLVSGETAVRSVPRGFGPAGLWEAHGVAHSQAKSEMRTARAAIHRKPNATVRQELARFDLSCR
jgi:hypothetical protein